MEKNFGTRVRQARHKAGLTQAALAEKLNLDETTISRICKWNKFQQSRNGQNIKRRHKKHLT